MEDKTNIIQGKKFRFTVLSEILIRLEYSENGVFSDELTEFVRNRNFTHPKFDIKQDDKFVVIETDYFRLEYMKDKPFVGTKLVPEAHLKVLLKGTDKYWFYKHVEARNFKTVGFSIDNKESISYTEKGLYSTDGFVSIDDSKSYILKDDRFYRAPNNIDIYLFMYKRDFGLCLRDYFNLTGKPIMIPRYMFGNIWNKDETYTDKNIKDLIDKFNKNDIPINYILLGKDWHNKNGYDYGLNWNNDLFIDYNKFIDYLKLKNVNLGVTINPLIINDKEKNIEKFLENLSIEKQEQYAFNLFDKNMIDNYFNTFIEPLVKNGVNGFLIDVSDYKSIVFLRLLNYYHARFFEKNNMKSSIISRNSLINTHLTNIIYTGKTIVSWKLLSQLPEYIYSACNKGISYISTDIGGFYGGIEDDELYIRYIQFGTFSPILRLSSDRGKYYKREPWKWDAHTLTISKYYLRLRAKLIPYLYSESYNYSNSGLPIIQPLYYKYPEIYDEVEYRNEYYFGKSLFVCPITKQKDQVMNRTVQSIYLPEGTWYDFKTGNKYVGNKRYISFYKDEDYPVFATKGSIIPLAKLSEENLNASNNPDGFDIHIFPGKSNSYVLYEDDSILNNKDNYVKTTIEYNYMLNNYTVIIKHDITDSSVVPGIRSYTIRFRNTRLPNQVVVYVGEEKLENSKYYVDENDFVLEIERVQSLKQITINCKGQDIEIDTIRIINKDIDDILKDLKIKTNLKESISNIMFSDNPINQKRIYLRKLKKHGLHPRYINMFLKLLELIVDTQEGV